MFEAGIEKPCNFYSTVSGTEWVAAVGLHYSEVL